MKKSPLTRPKFFLFFISNKTLRHQHGIWYKKRVELKKKTENSVRIG
ncbi:unnamed protein product, partial [Larinioides sclopetarius]